jgi:hypothetical protein
MKMMWCWRCKTDVFMLDDDEYRQVMAVRGAGQQGSIKEKIYGPMLAEYERITGFYETNAIAIFHHRAPRYGPPCVSCGKPLRTPKAKLCGHCMKRVDQPSQV